MEKGKKPVVGEKLSDAEALRACGSDFERLIGRTEFHGELRGYHVVIKKHARPGHNTVLHAFDGPYIPPGCR